MLSLHKIRGFNLIELMLGLSLGVIVTAATLMLFVAYNQSNLTNLSTTRLNHELRTTLKLMVEDIRRAGYWADATDMIDTSVNSNPFTDPAKDADLRINASEDCILFSYDSDKSGGDIPALNDPAGDERFGYRLSNNAIQSRAIFATDYSCTAGPASDWDDLTDTNIVTISDFQVTQTDNVIDLYGIVGTTPDTDTLLMRTINLSITGELANNPDISQTLDTQIRVRNDIYIP